MGDPTVDYEALEIDETPPSPGADTGTQDDQATEPENHEKGEA